jgi:hypothetical protein
MVNVEPGNIGKKSDNVSQILMIKRATSELLFRPLALFWKLFLTETEKWRL